MDPHVADLQQQSDLGFPPFFFPLRLYSAGFLTGDAAPVNLGLFAMLLPPLNPGFGIVSCNQGEICIVPVLACFGTFSLA
ncbi:hypothetical protein RHSIM_Rhsim09G0008300 [Rhododendron simsii]|uniref:Uncharacterized protein n=1 Tax=Rhododendron simsii TaxID=118357 RepID=A0A834GFP3_RHOSS|nr:hypothetical protein RHSIM_Rhsim09G0008300 [Rhododendron simsii]